MLEKTIKTVLRKKLDRWIDSIWSTNIQKIVRDNVIVTGGSIVSLMQNEEPKDFDIYFKTKEATLAVAEYYQRVWNQDHPEERSFGIVVYDDSGLKVSENGKSTGKDTSDYPDTYRTIHKGRIKLYISSSGVAGDIEAINADEELGMTYEEMATELDEVEADKILEEEKKPYHPVFVSSNAITLSDKIQIITRFYGNPEEIHDTFDFEHTKAYYDYKDRKLVIPKGVYECVMNKTLRYTGSRYPVCSVFRLRKFIGRGWHINAGQMLRMCMQISDLDLQDINVLEDQLIGVDSIFFMNLIEQFNARKRKDSNFILTTDYVSSIIDKIF